MPLKLATSRYSTNFPNNSTNKLTGDANDNGISNAMGIVGFALLPRNIQFVSNNPVRVVVNQAADGDELADKQWGKIMTKAKLVRRPNGELRTREYLTGAEVERLIKAARS